MRSNLDELEAFVDLAEELGVERIARAPPDALRGPRARGRGARRVPPERANERFRAFLQRVSRSRHVTLTGFPDFFHVAAALAPNAHCGAAADAPDHALEAPRVGTRFQHPRGSSNLEGALDEPASDVTLGGGAVRFSGWALDRRGPVRVELVRAGLDANEPPFVVLGVAHAVPGARSDVARVHPDAPHRHTAAFVHDLRREDLPAGDRDVLVHVIGRDTRNRTRELGRRLLRFREGAPRPPTPLCKRPFESLYVDADGDVFPYPDCQTVDPFGRLGADTRLEELWYGEAFQGLRERLLRHDPPAMCLTCPDRINRCVDDHTFFEERKVEGGFRLPHGVVEAPAEDVEAGPEGIELTGWAGGFEEFDGVEVRVRGDAPDDGAGQGWRVLGRAVFVPGERPDVWRALRHLPRREQVLWRFHVRAVELRGEGDEGRGAGEEPGRRHSGDRASQCAADLIGLPRRHRNTVPGTFLRSRRPEV
jgi:hypothetical protein